MILPQDEWVISRVFQKTGAGNSSAAKKRLCDAAPEVSSPCSVSLPSLLEPSADCYDVNAATSKEHVPCFSMAAPPTFSHNPLSELPPPPTFFSLMHYPSSPPPSSSASRFGKHSSSFTAFPTLRSLQENLHMPLVFSAAAPPPMHGGGHQVFGDGGVSQWPAMENQKVCGSELDCMWS